MIIKIIKTVIWIFLIIVLIGLSLQLLEKILFKIYSIDAEEMVCLETGCCHEGYRFKYCVGKRDVSYPSTLVKGLDNGMQKNIYAVLVNKANTFL